MLAGTLDPRRDRGVHWRSLWGLVFGGFLIVYAFTAQKGVSWQDSGMYQWRVLTQDYEGFFGLALAHPLYIEVAQFFTYVTGDHFIWLFNAFSGLGMAVALANLAVLLTMLTGRYWIGSLVAAMLGVSHMVWWLSTVAEVYTWSAAGLTAELVLLYLLVKRPRWQTLALLALVSGMGWSVHNFALLPILVYGGVLLTLIVRRQLPPWALGVAAGAYVLGASSYVIIIVAEELRRGDLIATMKSALWGDRFESAALSTKLQLGYLKENAALFVLNFTNPLWLLAVVGLWHLRKLPQRTFAVALYALTAIELLFFVRYFVPDQATFAIPSLVMLAVAVGVGIKAVVERAPRIQRGLLTVGAVFVLLTPLLYLGAFQALRVGGVDIQRARPLPFRDEMRYWLIPWKHDEHSAELFATAALSQVRDGAVIFADGTSFYPLLLKQSLADLAPNVRVYQHIRTGDELDAYLASGADFPLYVVSPARGYTPPILLERNCNFAQEGVLYKVTACNTSLGLRREP